ncbi:MAG: NAD(P)/FAD-dependent oxidoreductase [Chloroflexi bacterium]|nr:NAD(P)/FAD-dependent oxidoreductase [Chloroflexota bacterium]
MVATKKGPRVIIGNSHSALAALECIHRVDPETPNLVLTRDDGTPYSPTALVGLIAGEVKEQKLNLKDSAFYDSVNARVLPWHDVEYLDAKNQQLVLGNGARMPYGRVLVATGSIPLVPKIPGLTKRDTNVLHNIADARKIIELCKRSKKVVTLGAGLIAVEAAMALRQHGLNITIVARSRILRAYIDAEAGAIIADVYRQNGIKVLEGSDVSGVESSREGMLVVLESGEKVRADFVLVATGVKPNTGFLIESGIDISDGLIVNEKMQTNDPLVYAAGDVAQGRGLFTSDKIVVPTIMNAVAQGKVAGTNMAGGNQTFAGSLPMNIYNFFGNVLFSIGLSGDNGRGTKVLKALDTRKRSYKKLVLRDGRLVGCTMINQSAEAGVCREAIMNGWESNDVEQNFADDLASAFRRTLIKESGREMARQRESL